jgi:hypothetical protein
MEYTWNIILQRHIVCMTTFFIAQSTQYRYTIRLDVLHISA